MGDEQKEMDIKIPSGFWPIDKIKGKGKLARFVFSKIGFCTNFCLMCACAEEVICVKKQLFYKSKKISYKTKGDRQLSLSPLCP